MKKPGIPAVNIPDQQLAQILSALKENVEIITGARPQVSQIDQLSTAATLSDAIAKINEIVIRLNARGA